jgi:DnaJ-class molecular chaperone
MAGAVIMLMQRFRGKKGCRIVRNRLAAAVLSASSKEERTMRNKAPDSQSSKTRSTAQMQAGNPPLNPGDEAARGTPGTGDDICPECHGNGRRNGSPCPNCGGSGTITRAIGGA